ncbi:MAG: UDP-3-O-(3-hydroxymyristoyl)glucosamine N-acyltransferase [Candidatus Rokubacteria bacterium]|nr:UDP-3-O-(3-hydroxymyristoyl)glucosamine N-acyltransferase [Candidatus Rokubacteria bacterium]
MGDTGGPYTLGQLARALGAVLEGDSERIITGVAPLETAGPDQISFVTHRKYLSLAGSSRAGALLVPSDVKDLPGPLLRTGSPHIALITLLGLFHPAPPLAPGLHPSALVARDSRIHPGAWVGAFAVIQAHAVVGAGVRIFPFVYVGERAEIGEETTVYPNVVIREGVRIGRRVIIHPGAVLGSDGFGYAFDGRVHRKIPQVGGVIVEDDVEIGANVAIDRATLGDTVLRRGTKIDNLVQVGHNVEIGEDAIVVAQTGISGSCRVGKGAMLGGQVGIADHVTLGDGVMLGAQSGVPGDIRGAGQYLGSPARPIDDARRIYAAMPRLPALLKKVRALERRVRELEGRLGIARAEGERPDDG